MRWLVGALMALLLAPPALGTVWYVHQGGSGDATTVQDAIDLAAPGDTVLVAAGTYTESQTREGRTSCAFLKPGLSLISESGPDVTVLDLVGEGGNDGVVVHADGIGAKTVQGFTIQGAAVGGMGLELRAYPDVSGFTLRDCIFRDFEAHFPDPAAVAINDDRILIVDCLFERCSGSTHYASALFAFISFYVSAGHLEIRDTVFRDCTGDPAAYVAIPTSDTAIISGCRFERNSGAWAGSGLFLWGPGQKVVEHCVFLDNTAIDHGGALWSEMGYPTLVGNTFHGSTLENGNLGAAIGIAMNGLWTFRNNIVSGSAGAAGVWLDHGPADIGCNVFWDNSDGNTLGWVLQPTDREVDPLFCDPETGQLGLRSDSPCLPASGDVGCERVGALPVACGPLGVHPATWARVKAAYRGP